MSRFHRAAGFAVTSVCALAAMGAVPAQRALGAPLAQSPVGQMPVSQMIVTDPLPVAPALENAPGDGIATDIPVEKLPEFAFPAHPSGNSSRAGTASLTSMVSRFADMAPGSAELDCLAKAVYFEAKGEPLTGQLAVAEVIMNRAKSGRFAPTLCGVVKQPSQFSFVRGGGFPPVVNQAMWRQAVGVAHVAANGLWDGPAQGALYFHAKRVSPNWGKRRVAAVGNHIFYR